MGLYDIIWVQCPKCKDKIDFHTKVGNSSLYSYTLGKDDIPLWIEASLAGELFHCAKCGTWFEFDVKVITKPKILKRRPSWADDTIIWTQDEDEDEDCR